MNLFTQLNYKIDKPIKLIQLFAGYGSQALALKYLNVPFIDHKICEWAVPSIQAYKDLHFPTDNNDYSVGVGLVEALYNYGISMDYNTPMTKDQIKRKGVEWCKRVYNNIIATHNLVNICNVKGSDLEIDNEHCNIITYSFPCQDLSLAGKLAGLGEGTRSGLLWEVGRLLNECVIKPDILIMENVPQVHNQTNIEDFNKWCDMLADMGYVNFWKDLNAKNYGIPQNRNRTFMVSIYSPNEYVNYDFPEGKPLALKLKDLLEGNVDEKYYLSIKQIEEITQWNAYQKPLETMERIDEENVSPTLTTRSGAYAAGMILVKNNTQQGYLLAEDGDGVDISSRMEHHRGTVQKGMAQTLLTDGRQGVVVHPNYIQWEQKGLHKSDTRAWFGNKFSGTLTTKGGEQKKVCEDLSNLRIRKLTPRECGRLMGVRDEDIDKIMKNQSNSKAYHLFGDSIVVDVLMAIFKELI